MSRATRDLQNLTVHVKLHHRKTGFSTAEANMRIQQRPLSPPGRGRAPPNGTRVS
ncbi:hypothetical protein DPMN_042492 [Dreissena polymorpha]|uniref:Uncharacterized protein n=1 Tax=Dreissena polymorpha TaxID=45954 RepID=A0A9D4CYP7_DREPO|nr:hypothetical protein DPMN_042492 [Dreissena polymorpha]